MPIIGRRSRWFHLLPAFVLGTVGSGAQAFSPKAPAGIGAAQADPSTMADAVRAWRELKYGMFIHYGMPTYDGDIFSDGSTPAGDFNPQDLDVDQWIRTAVAAGMKYAVLTAKHTAGFCLWDSKANWKGGEFDYDVGSSPVEIDVVAAYMDACRKYGIVPGVYYCAMDLRHSHNAVNWTPSLPYVSEEYFQLMKDHLTELHTAHPEIAYQWIDIPRHLTMEQRSVLYDVVRGSNPECLVMYNYGQESRDIPGDYTIEVATAVSWPSDILNSEKTPIKRPFQGRQEYQGNTYELGYEHCISITSGWFWSSGAGPKSLGDLKGELNETWERNGNFLLNVPPDQSGQIPQAYVERLVEIRSDLGLDTTTATAILPGNRSFGAGLIAPGSLPQATVWDNRRDLDGDAGKLFDPLGRVIQSIPVGKQPVRGRDAAGQRNMLPWGVYLNTR